MFIRCEHVAIVLILGFHVAQSQYDFSEAESLWNLTVRATSLTSNIAKNSLKISSKLLNAVVGSNVRDFLIFLKTRAHSPPELSGVVKHFDDGSVFEMSKGVMLLGDKFRVRIEAADTLGIVVHCSGIPVQISYKNFNFTDANGVITEGYVTGSIRKLDISYKLIFRNPNCPLALYSITVNSIQTAIVKINSKTTFASPQLKSYLGALPKKWEQEIPKSLVDHSRLNPIGRGILACNEPNLEPILLN